MWHAALGKTKVLKVVEAKIVVFVTVARISKFQNDAWTNESDISKMQSTLVCLL